MRIPLIFVLVTLLESVFASDSPKPKSNISLQDLTTVALPDRSVCGLEHESHPFGGRMTSAADFPWVVALEYKSKITGENAGIKCGGSILNNRYVLTAAQCLLHQELELTNAWLGEAKISTNPDCADMTAAIECADVVKKIGIQEAVSHPYYSKRTGSNDIGLLRLTENITYTRYIRPICLPPHNLPIPKLGMHMTIAGWGATENGTTSDDKVQANLPLVAKVHCIPSWSERVSEENLCVGGEGGKDMCGGDLGGPLMRTFEHVNQWFLEGVGAGCNRGKGTAAYTKISRYMSWIINTIEDN